MYSSVRFFPRFDGFSFWAAVLLAFATTGSISALAQTTDEAAPVTLRIEHEDRGLMGLVRRGGWTPLRMVMESRLTEPREIVCQWILEDNDGDRVIAQRPFTLNNTTGPQQRWLYAQPSVNMSYESRWTVQVVDANTGEILGFTQIDAASALPGVSSTLFDPAVGAIGVTGRAPSMGLDRYIDDLTQHESIYYVEMKEPALWPDRWYGYDLLDALIWTRRGPNPDQLSDGARAALREWVYRGGHLVFVVPAVGHEPWTRNVWFADLLPEMTLIEHTNQLIHEQTPFLLPRIPRDAAIDYFELKLPDEADPAEVSVLLRDRSDRPIAVAKRYGFGRITVIGVDLSDRNVERFRIPGRPDLWRAVFGWQSPAYDLAFIEANKKLFTKSSTPYELWSGLENSSEHAIGMRGRTSLALLLAMMLFGLYWLAAGPVGFAVLKTQKKIHYSWLVFAGVVTAFSAIAWGGAYLLRPGKTEIRHFSVVDFDARMGDAGQARVQSWMSLYAPKHGPVEIKVDPDRDPLSQGVNTNVLGSAGILRRASGQGGYTDSQTYVFHAGSPNEFRAPFRSTSRQLETQYVGPLHTDNAWLADDWIAPTVSAQGLWVKGDRDLPTGAVSHNLPGALTNLFFIYCPGETPPPAVRRYDYVARHNVRAPIIFQIDVEQWSPGQVINLTGQLKARNDKSAPDSAAAKILGRQALTLTRDDYLPRNEKGEFVSRKIKDLEGYLGKITDSSGISADTAILGLSFYNLFPPPDFRPTTLGLGVPRWRRGAGRNLDLSALTATRQLIVIGQLRDATLPVPMSVDGQLIDSHGGVVVRWFCPVNKRIDPPPAPTSNEPAS